MNLLIVSLVMSVPVFAYVGPGIGAGTLAIVLGFIASIFLAIFAVLWYPLKRLLRKRKTNKPVTENADES